MKNTEAYEAAVKYAEDSSRRTAYSANAIWQQYVANRLVFTAKGFTGDEAWDISAKFVELTLDIAALHNVDPWTVRMDLWRYLEGSDDALTVYEIE